MTIISLLIPTRKRHERLAILLNNIKTSCEFPDKVETIFYVDEDDTETIGELQTLGANYHINRADSIVLFSDMWNKILYKSSGDILFTGGDDIEFKTFGWDTQIRNIFDNHSDKILLIGTEDGIQHGNLAVHPFVHKNWVNTLGYILPPYFKYWYADNWLTDVARTINRYMYLPNIVIQHVHGITGHDETYRKNEHYIPEATQVWNQTAQLRLDDAKKLLFFIENFRNE